MCVIQPVCYQGAWREHRQVLPVKTYCLRDIVWAEETLLADHVYMQTEDLGVQEQKGMDLTG